MRCCKDSRCGPLRIRRTRPYRKMGALAAGLDPMFLRLLFLLLLALNLGAAAWLLFGTGRPAPLPPATDPGVPELRLLSEMPRAPPPRPAPPAASASGEAGPPADRCETLGPFQTQTDMRAAMQALSPHVPRIQYRQEQVNQLHGYWVYLPATGDRECAVGQGHPGLLRGDRGRSAEHDLAGPVPQPRQRPAPARQDRRAGLRAETEGTGGNPAGVLGGLCPAEAGRVRLEDLAGRPQRSGGSAGRLFLTGACRAMMCAGAALAQLVEQLICNQ